MADLQYVNMWKCPKCKNTIDRLDYDVPVAKTVGVAIKSLNEKQLAEISKWLGEE